MSSNSISKFPTELDLLPPFEPSFPNKAKNFLSSSKEYTFGSRTTKIIIKWIF